MMKWTWLIIAVIAPNIGVGYGYSLTEPLRPWVYKCEEEHGRCVKLGLNGTVDGISLGECKLTCDKDSTVLPRPRTMTVGKDGYSLPFRFQPGAIKWNIQESPIKEMLEETIKNQIVNLDKKKPIPQAGRDEPGSSIITLDFQISDTQSTKLRRWTSEKYTLSILPANGNLRVSITADKFFGARHALETFFQLVEYDDIHEKFVTIGDTHVEDEPEFRHRGVLLDTSRNFMSKEVILRIIDGMAHNKLNVFHWHIADSHSFPIQLEKYPETKLMVEYGAYGPDKIYTTSDVREIVQYANLRGVRVVPEFDAPGHVGNGWQFPGAENYTVCVNKEPWYKYCVEPPCGQLNPFEEGMYDILDKIYEEYHELFDSDTFHVGGDEVNLGCWNSTDKITEPMKKNGIEADEAGFFKVWDIFQNRSYNLLTKNSPDLEVVLWTSHMTWEKYIHYLPADKYTIQMWDGKGSDLDDPQFKTIFDAGHNVIVSNYDAFYLDCGYGAWVGEGNNWCSPYKGWQTIYENDLYDLFAKRSIDMSVMSDRILGGEVCLWSEQVDSESAESKIFPRASALAERLWSNPQPGTWYQAQNRMIHNRERLVQIGVKADRLQPEWCRQNERQCYSKDDDTFSKDAQ